MYDADERVEGVGTSGKGTDVVNFEVGKVGKSGLGVGHHGPTEAITGSGHGASESV